MKEERRRKILILAFAIMPIATFFLSIKKSPFNYTLSMIGNRFDYRTEFILWGILTAALLTMFLIHLYKQTKFEDKKIYRYSYAAGIFLILTVSTPVAIKGPIEKSIIHPQFSLHLVLSLAFAAFLLISLFLFLRYISLVNKKVYSKARKLLWTTIGGTVLIMIIFGMSGLFELFFFSSLFIYLIIIEREIEKMKDES